MKGIVDRIEGDFLVVELETGEMTDIRREKAPLAIEGDVLSITDNSIVIEEEETTKRQEYIKKLFDDLLE